MKRAKPEPSTSPEELWEELDPGEVSKVLIADHKRQNLQFLYRSSDKSAVKIFKASQPRNKKITVLAEKNKSMRTYIDMHNPTSNNLLDHKYFLYPLRSLIRCVHFLNKKYGDFSFDETDIIVCNFEHDPRLKVLTISDTTATVSLNRSVLTISDTTATVSLNRCMSSIVKIIDLWFKQYSIQTENYADLMLLIHCLKNMDTFPIGRRVQMLSLHPVFYTQQEKHLLFDMVERVDATLDKYYKGKHDIGVDIVDALKVINGDYTVHTEWVEDAKNRGVRPIGAVNRCLNAKPHDKDMYSFLHSVRNLGVHLDEHIWKNDAYSMRQCARNLEEMVPGCFSAIFQMILVYGMEVHFLTGVDS